MAESKQKVWSQSKDEEMELLGSAPLGVLRAPFTATKAVTSGTVAAGTAVAALLCQADTDTTWPTAALRASTGSASR